MREGRRSEGIGVKGLGELLAGESVDEGQHEMRWRKGRGRLTLGSFLRSYPCHRLCPSLLEYHRRYWLR